MARARAECDVVAVSIFVNPLQFGDPEDIARLPADARARPARPAPGPAPTSSSSRRCTEMYPSWPEPPATTVSVRGVSEGWEGASRPGHFDGVATVVAKLFSIAGPCRAYFGLKDFQQLAVVRRMVRRPVACPSRWWAARSCARPTGWPSRAATCGSRRAERRAAAVLSAVPWPPAGPPSPPASARARPWPGHAGRRRRRAPGGRSTMPSRSTPCSLDEADAIDDPAAVRLLVAAQVGPVRLIDNSRRPGPHGRRHPRRTARARPPRSANSKGSVEPMRRRMMKSKIHRATVTGPTSTTSARCPSTPS